MSIYSFTTLNELSSGYISTRTRNVCAEHKMFTVHDVWEYGRGRFSFRRISNIGKIGDRQLQRISRKANEIMGVMPLTKGTKAPDWIQGFSLVALYRSLDEAGKQIADNVYTRFCERLRATGQRTLADQCGNLTLAAFLNTMQANDKMFKSYTSSTKGYRSEVGQMIRALYTFFQSDLYREYMANPQLTLLRQQMHKLMGCLDERMDQFLTGNWNSIARPDFPLWLFIDKVIQATSDLPGGTKKMLEKAHYACRNQQPTAGRLWEAVKERNLLHVIPPAIRLLEKYGYSLPMQYQLPNSAFHTGDVVGQALYHKFSDLFISLVYSPGYSIVKCRVKQGTKAILIKNELLEQLDFTAFLREVYLLTNEYREEAYRVELLEVAEPFYEADMTEVEEKKLLRIAAELLDQLYDLTTDQDGQLEI